MKRSTFLASIFVIPAAVKAVANRPQKKEIRLSVDGFDPGYHPKAIAQGVEVYVDGAKVENVITADEKEGFVVHRKGKSLSLNEMRGKVEIILPGHLRYLRGDPIKK